MLNHKVIIASLAGFGLVVGGMFYSRAQADDQTAKPAVTTPAANAKNSKPAKVMSPDEMRASATTKIGEIESATQRLSELQALARVEKDSIKLGCVNDQYVLAKQIANNADDANQALGKSIDERGTDAKTSYDDAKADYDDVADYATQMAAALETAEACLGSKTPASNNTDVKTTKPIIAHDPTKDNNVLGGETNEQKKSLEYVQWASPFAPKD